MANHNAGRSMLGRLLATATLCAGLFAGTAQAELYNGAPTRTIGPFAGGQTSPVPGGGWQAGDDRVVGASIGGQGGWSVTCSPGKYDEEISDARARNGLQSWRLSNWFHDGCVDTVLSPAFASIAEAAGPTGTVVSSFWFNVPAANDGLLVSASLTDATGRRMTYAAIRMAGASLTVQAVGIAQGSGYAGMPLPAPFDDPGVEYSVHTSGSLSPDTWYQLRVTASLVIGPRDDQITYEVLDGSGNLIWSSGVVRSWEDGYFAGPFASPNTKVTISRLGFRIIENPDDWSTRTPWASYALNRPTGVYIDDLSILPGGGQPLNVGFEGDRYVGPLGTDTGNCAAATPAAARCRTVAYAVSVAQPYNRIHVAPGGTYEGTVSVTQEGLQILAETGAPKPILTRTAGPTNQRILFIDNARKVRVEGLQFDADKTFVGAALLAMRDIEGLAVVGNTFISSMSGAPESTFGLTNAIAINYSNEGTPLVDGRSVLIDGNTVTGSGGNLFRAGVQMDRGLGVISNNTITSGTQDIVVRFATAVSGVSTSDTVDIHHNTLLGRGAQITSPNASVANIAFHDNELQAVAGFPGGASAYAQAAGSPADFSLLRLVHNSANVPLSISNNQFKGHGGDYRGVLIQNYPNVTLTGNTFTPEASADDFASLVISNKELTTDALAAPLSFSVTAKDNTFNGSAGKTFNGRAVEFINDNANGASSGTLLFGGAGADQNKFSGDHRWYFRLDDQNCDFAGGTANCSTYLNYPGVSGSIPPSQLRPFSFDVNATDNLFGGTAPGNPAQVVIVQRTYDALANPLLGIVSYNVAADQPVVYVDDNWSSNVYGDPLTFTSVAVGSVPVQFGINAFATIPSALMHVQTAGTVHVAKGGYPDPVVVDRQVQIIGDGEGGSDTVLSGGVTITGSGASADPGDRLTVNNLRVAVSGPGSVGINFNTNAAHVSLQNVTVTGAVVAGLQLVGNVTLDDIKLDQVTATANLGVGLRTATTTRASNVAISHSEFSDNGAGIILFGASNTGDGQITDWSISDSRFLRNDNADASAFGGGLWLKTGGDDSKIDGFVIERSQFIDNGSSVPLNRTGITIRARPNTTLVNVSICDNNEFANTGDPGTQATGINVFDQTGNTGYSPITVCADNDFTGVPTSISGLEQNNALATQPIVNITGGSIANTEYINGFVTRIHGGTPNGTFNTIAAALADAGTADGDTIHAPAGLYNESILITRPITLLGDGKNATIIDGGNRQQPAIEIYTGITGVTIRDLQVRNAHNSCVFAQAGNNNFTLDKTLLQGCRADLGPGGPYNAGGGGFYMNGPVDHVTLTDNEVKDSVARGLVIWNGFKKNITITGNDIHDMIGGCCGIELQDGTASGVTVTGNTVTGVGDSGMAFLGLTSGAGPNLIQNNIISNRGRYGIEIKLPNGTGIDDEEDGAIIVSGNTVTRTGVLTDVRDIGGIVVIRRAFDPSYGYVDIPTGVVVKNNVVSGWQQPGAGNGYGIVVEGTQMRVFGNALTGNDIAIQRQAGNDGYMVGAIGDSDQNDTTSTYFSRGNSPQTCAMIGPNTFTGNGADTLSIDTRSNALSMEPIAENTDTGRFYCTIQSAIDDSRTHAGNAIEVYYDTEVAEQVLVDKSITLTGRAGGANPATIKAPGTTNGDLALVRVAAPNVEISYLNFEVDLSKVGEAIRTVGGTPGGNPSGVKIHHNTIVATASGFPFISYGRRNALNLNTVEQVAALQVNVHHNVIGGTQDWDIGTTGDQPAYFRAAIALDQGYGTISANTLQGRDYDLTARYAVTGQTLTIDGNNQFSGGGLYLGETYGAVTVSNNTFEADIALTPFSTEGDPNAITSAKWGMVGLSAVRLLGEAGSAPITLSGNTFSNHSNAIHAQNMAALTLTGNTFNAPPADGEFRHLIINTKVVSTSSHTAAQVPLGISATGNTFNGSGANPAIAVDLVNHDNNNAAYGDLFFGGAAVGDAPNHFVGDFTWYFRMDASTGDTGAAGATSPAPYNLYYAAGSATATTMAPFANTVPVRALDNTFDGQNPSDMDASEVDVLQARTYHNDPMFVESPVAPPLMGRVDYGLADGVIPTTTTIVSATPVHGVVGTQVMVTVDVITNAPFSGTPSGTVTVSSASPGAGASCDFSYPANNSCELGAFASEGLKFITATFTNGGAASDSTSASASYQVFTDETNTTEVTSCTSDPDCTATAFDNDYTRVNNAVQLLQSGDKLVLNGIFDWTLTNTDRDPTGFAYASWVAHGYKIAPPAGRDGVTITAAECTEFGCGAKIQGPGDLPLVALEGVFDFPGGSFHAWEISNLEIDGFDLAISMQCCISGRGSHDFDDVRVLGNRIHVPADGSDAIQNIGVVFASGLRQRIEGNEFLLSVEGIYDSTRQASVVGIQNETTGNAGYDGLSIKGNVFRLVGTPDPSTPARVVGLWENDGVQGGTNVEISDNVFECTATSCDAPVLGTYGWLAIMTTSHSGGGKHFVIANNTVSNFSVAVTTLQGPIYGYAPNAAAGPVEIIGNTFLDNGIAVRTHSDDSGKPAKATLAFNRIASTGAGIGLQQDNAEVSAENNWWGCNEGPTAATGCTTLAGDPSVPTVSHWLKLKVVADPASIEAASGDASTIRTTLVDNLDGSPPSEIGEFPIASYGYVADIGEFTNSLPVSSSGGAANATFTSDIAGGAVVTTSLDNGEASTYVLVTDHESEDTVTVTPIGGAGTETDNDYTRINNAVQAAVSHTRVVLDGTFDWRSTAQGGLSDFAFASWAAHGYQIAAPAGFESVTITGVRSDNGTPADIDDDAFGTSITADSTGLAFANTVRFIRALPGTYRNWTIKDLHLIGFERPIAMVGWDDNDGPYLGIPIAAFSDVHVTNNLIDMSNARLVTNGSNIAVSFGPGTDIHVNENRINIPGDRDATSQAASTYGFLNYTTGGAAYSGLQLNQNHFQVGAPATVATPERIIPIWENSNNNDLSANLQIVGNRLISNDTAPIAMNMHRRVAILSNHASSNLVIAGNDVSGWGYGFSYMAADIQPAFGNISGTGDGVLLTGNDFHDNTVAIRNVGTGVGVTAHFNRIVGNATGARNDATGSGVFDAAGNWWGCNGGPGVQPTGCTVAANPIAGTVNAGSPLKLSVSATTPVVAGSAPSTVNALLSDSFAVNSGMADYVPASVAFATTIGAVATPVSLNMSGVAASTLTTGAADEGGAQIAATYDQQTATTLVAVQPSSSSCGTGPCTYMVTPATSPAATDNDYTRINNAVQVLQSGDTLVLNGTFNWSETHAAASWAKGSDGIGGTDDDYAIEPPRNLSDVTITAAVAGGAATAGGATIGAGGDLDTANLEGVFSLYGGSFRSWTISNIEFDGFDLAIGMFHDGGPVDAFQGVAITGNTIRVPADGEDANQNIGLHYAFGQNQTIADNIFYLDAGGAFQGPVAMQSNTSGGGRYDGLRIQGNQIHVIGTPDSGTPARVIGIWENAQDFTAGDIQVSGNSFVNDTGVEAPAGNLWRGFVMTSQSAGVVYRNNTVQGASVGFTTYIGDPYTPSAASAATLLEGNTLINNRVGIRVDSANGNAKVTARFNRIVVSSGTGVGVEQLNAAVDARNNWWGCNAGPSAVGCTSTLGTPSASPWLQLSLASDTPIVGAGGMAVLTASVNGNSNGDSLGGTTQFPAGTEVVFASDTSATVTTPVGTGSLPGDIGNARSTLSNIFAATIASAMLDNETVSTTVNVNQVSLHVELPVAGVVDVQSAPFPVTISNAGPALSETVSVHFHVSHGDGLTPSDLALEYEATPGNWLPVSFAANADPGVITASVLVGNLATSPLTVNLRATSSVTGTLEFFATLVGDASNALYSSDSGSVTVVATSNVVLSLVSGSPQSAAVNSVYASPLVVRASDGDGNPLANLPVTFTAPASGATVSFAPGGNVTGADGVVSSGSFVASSTAGAVTTARATIDAMACSAPGTCSVDFALTNTVVAGANAGLSMAGDAVGVVTLDGSIYSLSSATTTVGPDPAPSENVVAHITINRAGGVAIADLAIDYKAAVQEFGACAAASGGGWWCPLALSQSGSSVKATFGPGAGFPLTDNATSYFRTRYNAGGEYTVTTTIDGVSSNQTYASGSAVVNVAHLALNGSGPSSAATGVAVDTSVTLANSGTSGLAASGTAPNNENVVGLFRIARPGGVTAADVQVSYLAGSVYLPLSLSACPSVPTELCGSFGGGAGFPVGVAYNSTSLFRTLFSSDGVYTVSTSIVGVSSGAPFAQTQQVATIGASSSSIAIDPASLSQIYNTLAHPVVVTTTPAGLSYTLTYAGNPGAPTNAGSYAVVATITQAGYSGTASGMLVVAKAVSPVNFTGSTNVVYDGTPHLLAANLVLEPATTCAVAHTPDAAPTNVGTYTAAATCNGTNYTGNASTTLTIGKAPATVTLSDLSQTYDGSPKPVTVATDPSGLATSVTYDGSGTAPTNVGSYTVVATITDPNHAGSASGTLTISDGAAVALTMDGPEMALVTPLDAPYTDQVEYTGTLANTGSATSQKVHYRISVVRIDDGNGSNGNPPAIDADDVEVCLYDPSGWAAQDPSNHRNCPQDYQSLFISRAMGSLSGRTAVTFRYPNLAANDIQLPYTGPTPIAAPSTLFQFKRGEYRVQVDVVGSDSGLVYASATDATSVPEATVSYNGATSGPTEQALYSTSRLANSGGRVVGNVIVKVTLADAGAAALAPADVDFAYLDGASFLTLPWIQSGNELVTYFGPPSVGFELEDGHDATTGGRGIFHRVGAYTLRYDVIDVATGAVVYATTTQSITIDPNAVTFTLSDLSQVYDGTPRAVTVAPADVPHQVVYEATPDGSCPMAPAGNDTTPPTDAGRYCVYVTATGTYVGSASGLLTVAKAAATVSLDGAVSGTVTRTFDGDPQIVTATATPDVALVVVVTYNGSPSAPSAAGSYSLLATIDDPNHQGSTTGTLVIGVAGGATIVLDDVAGGFIDRDYTGSPVAPATATTTPSGIAYTVTYEGSGGTVYPLTSVVPTVVGTYQAVATTADANYAPVSASATLRIANASDAALSFSATPGTLPVNATSTTSATLTNSGGPIGENVLVRYTITRDVPGLVPGDVALRYDAGGLQPLGLAQIGSSLVGFFGPQPGGFPVGASYSATTAGDAVFHVAGVYSLTLDLVGVSTGTVYGTTGGSVTVTQGSGAITINASTLSAIYDGSPHPVTVTTNPAGLAYTITYDDVSDAPDQAGSYTVKATLADPNYSGSDTQTLTIAKAVSPVTFGGATNVSYTGSPQGLTAVLSQEPGSTGACAIVYSPGPGAPTAVGVYTVTATCNGINYTGSATTTLTISAANATITLSNLAQTYNGTPRPVTVTTTPSGLATTVTYNGSATVPTNAGTYTVIATVTTPGYSGTQSATLIVDKAIATVSIGNLTHVYNGLAKNATATTTPAGVPVTFTYNGSAAAPVNAGSYTVVATANGPNHTGTATDTLVISKAVATVTLSNLSQTYNGTPRPVTVATSPSGLAVSVSYDGSPTAPTPVGSYAVVATVVDANYQGSESGTLVIGKATATVTLTNLSQSYTGSPISASAITSPAGLSVSFTYDGSPTPPTAVGSYAVQATVGDANYVGTGAGTLVITQATAGIEIGNLSQVYNGAPKAVVVTTTPAGLPRTITYDGSPTPPSAVGSYAVVVTVTDPSYTGTATATLVITKASATVTLGNLSQVYNGSPRPVSIVTVPSGLTVDVTYNGSPTAPTATGTYAVVATVNDPTYQGTATGTLVVTNGNATVSVTNLSQVYDGAPKPVTVTTSPAGLTTTVTYNGSATVPTNAGTYTVVATVTSAGYTGSGAGTLVIGKATAAVVIGNLTHVYNGLAKNATATTTPAGVPVTFTYNGSAAAPVNAGSYTVVATANGPNHTGTATDTLVISKAVATVTLSNLSQTYNGTPRPATVTTSPPGLATSVSYDGNAIPPLAVGSYAVVASIVDANYQGSESGTLVIGKATATVTLTNLSQSYTGSPISASAITSPAGLPVSLTYDGSATPPTAVGSYAVQATVSDASYAGTGAGTLVITSATAGIEIGNLSQVYNGAPKAVSVTTTPAGLPRTITYDGSPTPPSAVGSYAVVVTVNDPNYTGTANATLVITKASATVTLGNLSQIYDGTPRQVSVVTTPSGLAVDVTYDGSATAPTATGTYAVVATVNDLTYQGTATGTLVVTNGNATIVLSNLTQTYNGTARVVTATTTPSGLSTEITYNGSTTAPTAAGTYTVVATITSAGYSGTAAGTLVVNKANATVTLGSLSQVYNGTQRTATATTNPAGLTVTFTYAGSATAPTNAGTYVVTGTVNDANYQGSATGNLTITKATATVALSGLSQTYSGSPRQVTATTTPASLAVTITYNSVTTPPVDAGSYPVVATISDTNYQGTASGTLVVAKASATVTLSNLSQSYNGTPRPVTVTTSPAGLPTTVTYNGSATVPTPVGSYAVLATINSTNYQGTAAGTLVIGDGSAAVTLGGLSHIYDGSPKAAMATTVPSGLTVSITYDGSSTPPTNAGSYAVVATIISSGYSGTASGTMIISKASATVALGALSQTYDGTPKAATATTTPSGLSVDLTYDGSATPPTSAGSYLVVATINDTNYQGTASGTLVVAKASATVTLTPATLTQTYNGTARVVTATTTPSGLTVDITYDGSATAPTAAGTYSVVGTINNPNYTGSAAGTLLVNKATATISITATSQVYNGTQRMVTTTTNPLGLAVNVSYAGSATAPTNAGSYAVTATINDANYQGTASGTLTITKATATVALSGLSQTYSGSPRQVTVTTTPASLAVTITYNSVTTPPVDAGSYPVVATISDTNYQGTASGTLVVAKASATVTLSNLSQAYNGSPRPVTVTTSPAGLNTVVTYNGSATVPTPVGSYAVLATIDTTNYEGSATGTLVISDGDAAVTLGNLSHIYDGSPKVATATTNPSGLTVSITYDGSSTPPTNAGSYAVVATITSIGYTGTASGTMIIAKASATVALGALSQTYDGTPKAATATTTPSGLAVDFTYDGSATAPTNAGTYLVVGTINDANYSGSATANLTIARATATVVLGGLTQSYDGTPRPVTATTTPSGLTVAITYDGSATAPSAVGTYAVAATVTNANYDGSAVGTLQIVSGSAGTIAANGPVSFTGTVSQPLAGPMPTVKVTDIGGNPVAGVNVTFAVTTGGGILSGATPTTDSSGVATLGGWTLGASAGVQTVTATAAGVTGSVLFTATASGTVELTVSVDSSRQYVQAGRSLSHLVLVGNSGSLPASGVTITSTLPAELSTSGLSWICVPSSGSSCGAATSGSGNLPTTVDIAAGGNVSFLITGIVLPGPTDLLTYSVGATRPSGTTGNDASGSRTTIVVIFRDGFDSGGDGAQGVGGDFETSLVEPDRVQVLAIDQAALAGDRITTLVQAAGGAFRVEAVRLGDDVMLRLTTLRGGVESASEWTPVGASATQLALSLDIDASGARLWLVCGDAEIEQAIDANASLSISHHGNGGAAAGD